MAPAPSRIAARVAPRPWARRSPSGNVSSEPISMTETDSERSEFRERASRCWPRCAMRSSTRSARIGLSKWPDTAAPFEISQVPAFKEPNEVSR